MLFVLFSKERGDYTNLFVVENNAMMQAAGSFRHQDFSFMYRLVRLKWLLTPFLPFLWLYRAVVAIRNFCYDRSIFKSKKISAFVISIGNLSMGGTGKTPLTIFLAKALRDQGWKVAIVARGYRREKSGLVVVSDGKQILADMAEAGDEPLLMAQACNGILVIVDRQKLNAARAAVERFAPDIILVDDGFQHRQLYRDLDVVTIDARLPLSHLWRFPAAPMRESASSLRRADFVILNTGGQNDGEKTAQRFHKYTAAKIFRGALQGMGWRELAEKASQKLRPLALVREQPVLLVSGIAHPERFRQSVEKLGAHVVDEMKFWDHHRYQKSDLAAIESTRKACRARYILTTSKDAGKLAALNEAAAMPFWVLETALAMDDEFLPMFLNTVRSKMD
jgi:tetraacyldisaccharide 4'-kinase